MDLKIDPEFEGLIPAQSAEEHQALIDSLNRDKFDEAFPIVTWNGTIIDGHNRYNICKNLGLEFETVEKDFKTREDVLMWIIDRQIERRNISTYYRRYLIGERIRLEKRQTPGRPKWDQVEPNIVDKSANTTAGKIAKESNASKSSGKRYEKYAQAADIVSENLGIPKGKLVDTLKASDADMKVLSKLEKSQQKQAVAKVTKGGKNIKDAIIDVKPPEPVKEPERNEQGVLVALPEKVRMQMVKIKPEHLFKNKDDGKFWLQCDIKVDDKQLGCSVYYEDVNGNFIFELPNVENLIIDFNEIFPTMTPIVSYRPVENEYLSFNRTFPFSEYDDFLESRFPDLMIDDKPERLEEALKPEKDVVKEQEANDKAKSPKQEIVTAKPSKKDKVASKTGATKEKQKVDKAPKNKKLVKDKPISGAKSKKPQNKVTPTTHALIDTLAKRMKLSYPETIDWLLLNKKMDMTLKYEKGKWKPGELKTVTFNFDGKAKVTKLMKEYDIEIDEVVWRLLNSYTSVMSSNQ